MRRASSVLYVAAVAVSMLSSGCSADPSPPASRPPATTTASAPSSAAAPLPPAEALADVMYRLADPVIPGTDKLGLLAGATASDAVVLDGFAAALRDGGFSPLTVSVADVGWADGDPGDVRALVTMTGPQPRSDGEFRFPLDFHPGGGGWQLSRATADLLLTATP